MCCACWFENYLPNPDIEEHKSLTALDFGACSLQLGGLDYFAIILLIIYAGVSEAHQTHPIRWENAPGLLALFVHALLNALRAIGLMFCMCLRLYDRHFLTFSSLFLLKLTWYACEIQIKSIKTHITSHNIVFIILHKVQAIHRRAYVCFWGFFSHIPIYFVEINFCVWKIR